LPQNIPKCFLARAATFCCRGGGEGENKKREMSRGKGEATEGGERD